MLSRLLAKAVEAHPFHNFRRMNDKFSLLLKVALSLNFLG